MMHISFSFAMLSSCAIVWNDKNNVWWRIMELSLLRTFAPGSESTMVWNFRSLELSFPGTFAPSESSKNFRSLEPSLPGTFAPGSKIPRTFTPTPSDFGRDIRSWICMHMRLHPSFNVCFTNAL